MFPICRLSSLYLELDTLGASARRDTPYPIIRLSQSTIMNSDKRVPARWPKDIKYLRNMVYSTSIPPNVLAIIQGTHRPTSAASAGISAPVTIRRIEDKSHPAHGQMGLFVCKKIPPNSHILDYMGEVHSDDRPGSDYDLSLYRSSDGSVSVGVSHFRYSPSGAFSLMNRSQCLDRCCAHGKRSTIR